MSKSPLQLNHHLADQRRSKTIGSSTVATVRSKTSALPYLPARWCPQFCKSVYLANRGTTLWVSVLRRQDLLGLDGILQVLDTDGIGQPGIAWNAPQKNIPLNSRVTVDLTICKRQKSLTQHIWVMCWVLWPPPIIQHSLHGRCRSAVF